MDLFTFKKPQVPFASILNKLSVLFFFLLGLGIWGLEFLLNSATSVDRSIRILMVCLGNICRSPLAEGILREKIKKRDINAVVDSAGTATYHIGENPDPRAVITAQKHNIDISHLVARQFTTEDFDEYDSIYVMDTANCTDVLSLARNEDDRAKVELLLNVMEPDQPLPENRSVPDPWHGGGDGFEDVFHLLDEACEKVVDLLK